MKLRKIQIFFLVLFLAGLIFILPQLFQPDILGGQLTKQVFIAEMARSFAQGRVEGLFPIRTFFEWYHDGPLPWAEEFPLFTLLTAGLEKISPLNIPQSGKCITFLFFLSFLAAGGRVFQWLSKQFFPDSSQVQASDQRIYWILLAMGSPVFLIYGISLMLEIPMMACLVWGGYFVIERKFLKAALFLALGCLFKYYGAFFVLGLLAFNWFRKDETLSLKQKLKSTALLAASPLPCILYLACFLVFKIPNPISEYHSLGMEIHLSSLSQIMSGKFFSRLFTWTMIKNTTPILGLLSLLGFFTYLKDLKNLKSGKEFHCGTLFLLSLLLSSLLFIFLFSTGVFIHDYYTIQLAFVLSQVGALFFLMLWKKNQVLGFFILLAQFVWGIVMAHSALRPQTYLKQIANQIQASIPPEGKILSIGDGAVGPPLYLVDRPGKMVAYRFWEESRVKEKIKNDIRTGRIQYIVSFFFGPGYQERREQFRAELEQEFSLKKVSSTQIPNDGSGKHQVWVGIDKI